MEEIGCDYMTCYDYDAYEDKPDIVILNHPWDMGYIIEGLRENAKYIVAASATVITYEAEGKEPDDIFHGTFSHYKPDVHIFDSLVYKKLMAAGKYPWEILEMGNPKYDGIYEAGKEKKYPQGWEKLHEKK